MSQLSHLIHEYCFMSSAVEGAVKGMGNMLLRYAAATRQCPRRRTEEVGAGRSGGPGHPGRWPRARAGHRGARAAGGQAAEEERRRPAAPMG